MPQASPLVEHGGEQGQPAVVEPLGRPARRAPAPTATPGPAPRRARDAAPRRSGPPPSRRRRRAGRRGTARSGRGRRPGRRSVISNRPSSLVEPKRCLTARSRRRAWWRSPSNDSTVSTTCSSTRGPASPPSLVTWPTRTTAMPRSLASRTSRWAHSRTCTTEPGAEPSSGSMTVWMESTTTRRGPDLVDGGHHGGQHASRPAATGGARAHRGARPGRGPAACCSSPET